ncbi:hypothetical protein EMIHUDRAFT_241616 [Emiliania huxleyi CCMP1516]|uniref:BTB domain-containing protein n=2 Tax=Emiliania huxleyi TaxID=2903 RepID=A0A0D3JCA9_EMIH1|nr:hypothetical protein EMIHUDRAFT_241616 [Emiliania huxleyi CCMP1516]EOD21144.1 hypothetical protein EMIHUDRAFT_241616 [Emiliania huxleyi CCMP1516]|eukprot:XP_005773573.1 hypothetical protein EMIHUDRAFT_241616 [Emiliania huxleyi CCMP1516]
MASAARKRARTAGADGELDGGAVAVADGFEAPLFGVRVVGQVTTLPLEGEDGPLALDDVTGVVSVARAPAGLRGIAISPDGSALFAADFGGRKILQVEVATGTVTTLAGSGTPGSADGVGGAAQFFCPHGVVISPDGSALFVTDWGGDKIRRVEVATGAFKHPCGVAISPDSSALFVVDRFNHKIRRVEVLATGAVITVAGSGTYGFSDGMGGAAQFYYPCGVAISPDGSALFVADDDNHKIRRVEVATGAVTTVAGSSTEGSADGVGAVAQFHNPLGVAISTDGSALLVCSADDGGLRQVCVLAPPPPPTFAPIVVPPSTLAADLGQMSGDASLPEGKVTFIVGDDEERVEHVSKNLLCIRSVFFRTMFGIGMKERDAASRAQRALDLRQLADSGFDRLTQVTCAHGEASRVQVVKH